MAKLNKPKSSKQATPETAQPVGDANAAIDAVAVPTGGNSNIPDAGVEEQIATTVGDDEVASEGMGEESHVVDGNSTSEVLAPQSNAFDDEQLSGGTLEGEAARAPDVMEVGASTPEVHHSVMPVHPAADLFPLLPDDQLQELAGDIKVRGLIEPIVTVDIAGVTRILDGRNRHRACIIAGVEPRTIGWDGSGGSPSGYVLAKNIHRRHLCPAQRAAIAVDLLPLLEAEARERQVAAANATNARLAGDVVGAEQSDVVDTPEPGSSLIAKGRSRDIAASALGVSGRSVQEAKTISEQAPEVLAEVRGGALSLPEGRRIAALPSPAQRKDAIKRAKAEKGIVKKRTPKVAAVAPKATKALDAVRAADGDLGRLLDGIAKEQRPVWWTALRNAVRKVAK